MAWIVLQVLLMLASGVTLIRSYVNKDLLGVLLSTFILSTMISVTILEIGMVLSNVNGN